MRTLVIDCATTALSLAVIENGQCVAGRFADLGRGHAEAIVPQLAELLDGTRCDRIAVDAGPGSFTGIRVGLAAARALGLAWGVPVHGYGCLTLCAAMVRDGLGSTDDPIVIVMPGGHGELFWQRFDAAELTALTNVASTPIAELAALLGDEIVHGAGAATLVDARGWGTTSPCLPDARQFGLLPDAFTRLAPAAIYGRAADARPGGWKAAVAS
jgi:tRNA threonylcarbamoyladenosine biosynthesis protein TsaB